MARIEKWDEVHGTQAPDERMMAFLDSTTDQYAILQLRRSEDTVYERFSSMRELERMGLEPDIDHYEVVYTAPLLPYKDQNTMLEELYRVPMDKKSRVNKYTPEGRVEIHKNLAGINMAVLYHLMNNPCGKQSVEYNDNRIALYVAQKGKCAVSGAELGANQVDCHHKKPLVLGGNDSYQNLIIVSDVVHILIHSSNERTIRKYLKVLNPDKKQLAKLNKLRVMAEMPELVF